LTRRAATLERVFRLVIEEPEGSRRCVMFDRVPITIGRKRDNQLVLPRLEVSRHHARLVQRQGWLFIEDLGSTSGTLVNGVDIRGQRRLHSGDRKRAAWSTRTGSRIRAGPSTPSSCACSRS
jgi:pSer/pThr/pTyr-binding forkhead associated (FHA) protein